MLGNLFTMNRATVVMSALLAIEKYGKRPQFIQPLIIGGPYSIVR